MSEDISRDGRTLARRVAELEEQLGKFGAVVNEQVSNAESLATRVKRIEREVGLLPETEPAP